MASNCAGPPAHSPSCQRHVQPCHGSARPVSTSDVSDKWAPVRTLKHVHEELAVESWLVFLAEPCEGGSRCKAARWGRAGHNVSLRSAKAVNVQTQTDARVTASDWLNQVSYPFPVLFCCRRCGAGSSGAAHVTEREPRVALCLSLPCFSDHGDTWGCTCSSFSARSRAVNQKSRWHQSAAGRGTWCGNRARHYWQHNILFHVCKSHL